MRPYGYIYLLRCRTTDKAYVGQTIQEVAKRWRQHQAGGGCLVLRAAIKKYGALSFEVSVLDTAENQVELNEKEVKWIGLLGTLVPQGYNLKTGGDGGGSASEQARQNMRAAQLGKKQSPEFVERRVAPLRGKKRPEVSQKLLVSWETRSRVVPEDVREKLSIAHQGQQPSATTREKMAEAQRARREREAASGVKPHFSPESREALRRAHTGMKHTQETRQKMSNTHRQKTSRVQDDEAGA